MNRQLRTLIVVAVALVAATVASYGVYLAVKRMPVRNVEVATNFAVVAAKAMPTGTRLTDDSVKLVAWPAKTPLANGFSDVDTVVDRGLLAAVVENEPITESKLAPREAGAGLPPSIPEGMRAMSVKVNEVIGVAGFVVPGTHVDVLVVMNQHDDSVARVVVDNLQVLAAGTRYDQEKSKDGKPIQTTVVTLLVTPDAAERVALAQSKGQLLLALRNPLDLKPTETRGVRTAGLLGAPAPAPVATAGEVVARPVKRAAKTIPIVAPVQVAPVVAAQPKPYVVEAIRGAKRTEEVVK